MNETSKRLINERLRLVQIRQGLTAAITVSNGLVLIPFYQAASSYLQHAMQRLHEQDIKMLAMIKEKATTIAVMIFSFVFINIIKL